MEKNINEFQNDFRNQTHEENDSLIRKTIIEEYINDENLTSSLCESINNRKFLSSRKIKEISDEDFMKLKSNYNLKKLKEIINKYKYKNKNSFEIIGLIIDINEMIEKSYNNDKNKKKEMEDKRKLFGDIVFHRPIKRDENNFYRAVIFRYFEIIILNKKIDLLKSVINEVNECYSDDFLKDYINLSNDKNNINNQITINYKLIISILILIYESLNVGDIIQSYNILVISMNFCEKFEYGLILYFRYILYKYIKDNKNQKIKEKDNIKLESLLPDKFKDSCNNFFKNNLLVIGKNAETIVMNVTPYVLNLKLNIFSEEKPGDDKIISFECREESDYLCYDNIVILLNNNNYNLLYYQNENNYIIQTYIKPYEPQIISTNESDLLNQFISSESSEILKKFCSECGKEIQSFQNSTSLCEKCLRTIKDEYLSIYSQSIINRTKFDFKNVRLNFNLNSKKLIDLIINSNSLDDFIVEIKKKCCICCGNVIDNLYYSLPCDCSFCSENCFRECWKNLVDKCINCGYYFESKEILKINNFLNQGKCCQDGNFYSLNYSFRLNKSNLSNINNSELDHYLCKDCYNKLQKSNEKEIICLICKSIHIYIPPK